MMDIRRIDENFAVAPQLQPEELTAAAEMGFAAIICNRPDGEETDQPAVADIRAAAERAGMAFHHIPVAGGAFPDEAIAAFRQARLSAAGPVLAYCRTGTRSITLETLANPEHRTVEDRLARARGAGYDLAGMSATLR